MSQRAPCLIALVAGAAACAQLAGLGDPPVVADDGGPEVSAGQDASGPVDGAVDATLDARGDSAALEGGATDAGAPTESGPISSAGRSYPLAVTRVSSCVVSDGGVVCWGAYNLGRGPDTSLTPGPVWQDTFTKLEGVTGLAGGGWTTCAFLADGGVSCWGRGTDLADADTLSWATSIPQLGGAVEITPTYVTVCWRADSTKRLCAGADGEGQLADGRLVDASFDAPVQCILPGPYAQTAASPIFNCAVQEGGTVHCMGDNSSQETSFATTAGVILDASNSPVSIPAAQVALGYDSACILGADGDVYCWGDNAGGAIGGPPGHVQPPVPVHTDAGALSNVALLTSGDTFYCALTKDRVVYCWGDNSAGQLGRGFADTGEYLAAPVLQTDGGPFGDVVALASANRHTCAVTSGGAVWCWGANNGETQPDGGPVVPNPVRAY